MCRLVSTRPVGPSRSALSIRLALLFQAYRSCQAFPSGSASWAFRASAFPASAFRASAFRASVFQASSVFQALSASWASPGSGFPASAFAAPGFPELSALSASVRLHCLRCPVWFPWALSFPAGSAPRYSCWYRPFDRAYSEFRSCPAPTLCRHRQRTGSVRAQICESSFLARTYRSPYDRCSIGCATTARRIERSAIRRKQKTPPSFHSTASRLLDGGD